MIRPIISRELTEVKCYVEKLMKIFHREVDAREHSATSPLSLGGHFTRYHPPLLHLWLAILDLPTVPFVGRITSQVRVLL